MSREFIQQYAHPKGTLLQKPGVGILHAAGTTVPADATSGFAPGCIFQDTDAAAGSQFYINQGTLASCAFKAIPDMAATGLALFAKGVAAGYKVARGVTALDGSNPTPVTTGLATVVAAVAMLEGTAAPGVGTSILTIASTNYATGALAVYAWKVTATGDCTLIASTGTENFEWVAIGT